MKSRRILVSSLVALSSLIAIVISILTSVATSQKLPLAVPPPSVLWLLIGITGLVSTVIAILLYYLQSDSGYTPSMLQQQNRQRMLEKVHAFWIRGVLEHSLYGQALITLGLHEQLDAVANPWRLTFHPSGSPLLPGTTLMQVYDRVNGQLLAVKIQSLTYEQINEYITRSGKQLEAVKVALQDDQTLRELVTTPLMLSVLMLAYRGKPVEDLAAIGQPEMRRQHILAVYIRRTLSYRDAKTPYPIDRTMRWLSWLAQKMIQHNQVEFYLERMQPDWLPSYRLRRLYRNTATWLVYGCIATLIFVLFAWLRGGAHNGLGGDLARGLLGWLGGKNTKPGDLLLGWMAPGLGGGLFGGTTIGIVYGIVYMLVVVILFRKALHLSLYLHGL